MENRKDNYSKYRRSHRDTTIEDEDASFKEIFVTQSIVCALVVSFILLMSLINIPFTQNVRSNLVSVMENTVTLSSIRESRENISYSLRNTRNIVPFRNTWIPYHAKVLRYYDKISRA